MQLYAHASEVEAELRQSRDQLGAILNGVADGVTAQDPSGKMVYANEAALELLGFPSVKAIQAVPIRYVLSRFDIFDENGVPFPLERLPGRQALMGEEAEDALVRFRRRTPARSAGRSSRRRRSSTRRPPGAGDQHLRGRDRAHRARALAAGAGPRRGGADDVALL